MRNRIPGPIYNSQCQIVAGNMIKVYVDNSLSLYYIYNNYMDVFDLKDDPYLNLLRPLVEAYRAIFEVGDRHIRSMGLTPPQFDVIAELGGTKGLNCVELSQSTLLAKASLTGIIDRLESKGLVERQPVPDDRRATHIRLTKKGEGVYRTCFPAQAKLMRPYFEHALTKKEVKVMREMLLRLRDSCRNPEMKPKDAQRIVESSNV